MVTREGDIYKHRLHLIRRVPMSIQPFTKRILVCEDSDTVARLWVAVLEQSGYKVVGPVSSAEKALEEAYQDLPDLAIIDIGLSGTIDGSVPRTY